MKHLEAALEDFGLPLVPGAIKAFLEKDRQMIVLGAAPQAVDLLNFPGGVEFKTAWERRISISGLAYKDMEDRREVWMNDGRVSFHSP
jgi:hypothetical protein